MRSIHTIAKDVFDQLGFSNESQATSLAPSIICSQALQEIDFEASELSKMTEKRKKDYTNVALGIGATAYVLIEIGYYFTENPQTLCTLGEGFHALWDNWETLTTVWHVGSFVGFENLWTAIHTTTNITEHVGYGMLHLANSAAHALDLYSLGAAIIATKLTKKIFDRLNKDDKTALEALKEKIKELNHIASMAEKAVPPAYLRNEIAKMGSHHFAY
jgi:hypothetical protein